MYLCKYNSSKKCTGKYNDCVECYKSHSVEIPDNATNGDVIKALFSKDIADVIKNRMIGDWWNESYKEEGSERECR